MKTIQSRLRGVLPASIVPMDEQFEIDFTAFDSYLDWLVSCGPAGVAVNVDTGEYAYLTPDERQEVVRRARARLGDRVVVAGVGGPGTAEACAEARRARDAGADSLLVFPTPAFFSAPLSPEVVLNYHAAIADASGLPLIGFHLAAEFGGAPYADEVLRRLIGRPELAALKEASFDAMRFREVAQLVGELERDFVLLNGNDTFLLEALLLGATGSLLGYGAVGCDLLVPQHAAIRAGDLRAAVEDAGRVQAFCDYIYGRPMGEYRARCKISLAHRGVIPPELTYVRPPYRSLWNTSDRERAREAVAAARRQGA